MREILALVEGQTEERFFNETCGITKPLRVLPNGADVPLEKVISVVVANVELYSTQYHTVLVWYDREGRDASSQEIAAALFAELSKRIPGRNILVGVPDRMIENWVLADEDLMRSEAGKPEYRYELEGGDGKRALRTSLGGHSLSPTETAQLLKRVHASRAVKSSPSFAAFHGTARFNWHWLER